MTTMTDFPQAEVFIETGAGGGATLYGAVHQPFKEIHSIEIDRGRFEEVSAIFKDHPQVKIHCGDSRAILPHIITPAKTTAFWLDAHWSGGNYREAKPEDECPLMGELEVIMDVEWEELPLIVIDDSFFFNGQWWVTHEDGDPYHREEWPTLHEVGAALPGYEVTDWENVLVCVPPGYKRRILVAGRQFP